MNTRERHTTSVTRDWNFLTALLQTVYNCINLLYYSSYYYYYFESTLFLNHCVTSLLRIIFVLLSFLFRIIFSGVCLVRSPFFNLNSNWSVFNVVCPVRGHSGFSAILSFTINSYHHSSVISIVLRWVYSGQPECLRPIAVHCARTQDVRLYCVKLI